MKYNTSRILLSVARDSCPTEGRQKELLIVPQKSEHSLDAEEAAEVD